MRAFDRDGKIRTVSPKMQACLDLARRAGASKASVLILGESGTGKELIAREVHRSSSRSKARFVAMNCAALPEGLLEAELFGHEKGAYTGATQSRIGKFELAHQGTLLLDEVSEMPLLLQAKLLRVLQEGELERVGSNRTVSVDVRVIATSNRDLVAMVKTGQFREDLYHRLHVISVHVPALRERPEDATYLAEYFADACCRLNGKATKVFSKAALEAIEKHDWPGNVRQLENAVERAVVLSTTDFLKPEDLGLSDNSVVGTEAARERLDQAGSELVIPIGLSLDAIEALVIQETLRLTGGNRTQAAKILGLSIRALRYKLNDQDARVNHG